MPFSLPELPYSYDALAPYMSRETLEFHHDKHHLAYVNNGNNLMKGTEFEDKPLEDVVKSSFYANPGLFNNAGQHYNHIHFWKWMKPGGGGDRMPGNLEKADRRRSRIGGEDEGGRSSRRASPSSAQAGAGSQSTTADRGDEDPNGESPLVHGARPILGCDVWEHSYYIDYRNRRPDYLKAFVDHLVDWEYVAEMFSAARK